MAATDGFYIIAALPVNRAVTWEMANALDDPIIASFMRAPFMHSASQRKVSQGKIQENDSGQFCFWSP